MLFNTNWRSGVRGWSFCAPAYTSPFGTYRAAFSTAALPLRAAVSPGLTVFDRDLKRRHRDWAASPKNREASRTVDYLKDHVAEQIADRLLVSTNRGQRPLGYSQRGMFHWLLRTSSDASPQLWKLAQDAVIS
jgi:hypothetical protein